MTLADDTFPATDISEGKRAVFNVPVDTDDAFNEVNKLPFPFKYPVVDSMFPETDIFAERRSLARVPEVNNDAFVVVPPPPPPLVTIPVKYVPFPLMNPSVDSIFPLATKLVALRSVKSASSLSSCRLATSAP